MLKKIDLSVIGPVYNEEQVLPEFHKRLVAVLESMKLSWEIVYVNDGSKDKTQEILRELHRQNERTTSIQLSRNFGKEIAMTAGLDAARGAAVVVIDTDLQDPPELIPTLYQHFQEGWDTVYAQRSSRKGESFFKKFSAKVFYRLMNVSSRVRVPVDTGDFRLLSRRAVEALKKLREQHRYMKGLFAWIGFPQKAILYDRDARFAGKTKWNFAKLFNLAVEGLTSFTIFPLKVATFVGSLTAFGAFAYGIFLIVKNILYKDPVQGYPSLMVVILFLGGIQLIALGLIGEYLGRMFNESKNRPLYLVQEYLVTPAESDVPQKN